MNNLEDRDVIILAAHCEDCGFGADKLADMAGAIRPFPARVRASAISHSFHCAGCGGRVVFDLMGASDDR